MPTINWREVFKFLSGAAFAGSLINFYLYFENVSVPFMGYTIGPRFLGARAAVNFVACVVFFYFGYVKAEPLRQRSDERHHPT